MVRRDADWKVQGSQMPDLVMTVLVGVLAVVYLYRWWQGSAPSAFLAVGLGLWGVLYYTAYWQPVLYLIGAFVLLGVTVVLLWSGRWMEPIDRIAIAFNLLFFPLSVYLLWSEESVTDDANRS